jgi:hypothetical protein
MNWLKSSSIINLSHFNLSQVRLICDYDAEAVIGSQVGRFRESGCYVRSKRTQYIMHHKFAVIDNKILITGLENTRINCSDSPFHYLLRLAYQKDAV